MRLPPFTAIVFTVVAVLALPRIAAAASADTEWLASAEARTFRDRVVTLALIYGDSSGIDPRGYRVVARQVSAMKDACADVEVVTSQDSREVARETLHACRH